MQNHHFIYSNIPNDLNYKDEIESLKIQLLKKDQEIQQLKIENKNLQIEIEKIQIQIKNYIKCSEK